MKIRLRALRSSAQPFAPWCCGPARMLAAGDVYDFELEAGADVEAVRKSMASVSDLVVEEKLPPGKAKKDAGDQV